MGATPPRAADERSVASDLDGPEGLEAKVVLLGSQGAGKTSLILRYTTGTLDPIPRATTIGSSLHVGKLVHEGLRVKLQIWDTAGQESFRSMAPFYYRGAHVCVLVYDTTDRRSFDVVRSWLDELGRTAPKETVIFAVGAKIDRPDRQVTLEEARRTFRLWLKPAAATEVVKTPFRFPSGSNSLGPTPRSSHTIESARQTAATSTPILATPMSSTPSEALLDRSRSKPFPALKIVRSSPTSPRQISCPQLQSHARPTSSTNTEHGRPSIASSSPTSRQAVSGGRFSNSGVLGLSRTTSMSGAISSLAQLAETHPTPGLESQPDVRHSSAGSEMPRRVRVETSPLLGGERRRSEDWSSTNRGMGERSDAAEALGESGAGVTKTESWKMLVSSCSSPSTSSGFKKPAICRSRPGSLGRDSRLYGISRRDTPTGSELHELDESWGVQVEGIHLGECSALSGQGVESLFERSCPSS